MLQKEEVRWGYHAIGIAYGKEAGEIIMQSSGQLLEIVVAVGEEKKFLAERDFEEVPLELAAEEFNGKIAFPCYSDSEGGSGK